MENISANQFTEADETEELEIDAEELLAKAAKERELQLREWNEIEALVMTYKRAFDDEIVGTDDEEEIRMLSKEAASELLERFYPLFKKYSTLLKTGQINFNDKETKKFVGLFIEDSALKAALKRKKQKAEYRSRIYQQFNFVKITYGILDEEEIEVDMHAIFLNMARRYKQMGKSFCGYLYNTFKYEMSRHIKAYTKNPINIPHRNTAFEDYIHMGNEPSMEDQMDDQMYENNVGIPDMDWVQGDSCSDVFACLTPIERKLIIKYYLEEWNDRQISEEFGIHINTINLKRRQAVLKLAEQLGIEEEDIKRSRKSGMKAIMPTS